MSSSKIRDFPGDGGSNGIEGDSGLIDGWGGNSIEGWDD